MEIKIKVEQNKPNIDVKLKDSIVVYRESGKELQEKNVEYIENGEYQVIPDDGYILENVNIKVNVPIPEGYLKPEGTINIDTNGEYDVTNYEKAIVNSQQDYSTEDSLITRDITHYANNRVKTIGERAMSHFRTLISCEFLNVETIKTYGFYGCGNLLELNFPKATAIEANAFTDCKAATICRLNSLKAITSEIVRSLTAMRIVYIPLVESIVGAPFADCTGLEAVIITQTNKVATLAATNAFVRSSIANGTGYVYIPDDLVNSYKTATNWSTFAAQIKGLSELPQEIREELGL